MMSWVILALAVWVSFLSLSFENGSDVAFVTVAVTRLMAPVLLAAIAAWLWALERGLL